MIYVVYSPQSRMVKSAVMKIVKSSLEKRDEFNFVTLDMERETIRALSAECSFLPFGYERKAVLAENARFLVDKKRPKAQKGDSDEPLRDYIRKPDPAIDLFFLCYSAELNEKSAFYKPLIEAGAKFVQVEEFTSEQWDEFIARQFKKRGQRISRLALDELKRRTKGDYSLTLMEIQKLSAYRLNEEEITIEDIKSLTSEPLEENAYKLADLLIRGNVKGAVSLHKTLRKSSFEPITLIRLLAREFRYQAMGMHLSNNNYDPYAIATELKIPQFAARRLVERARGLQMEDVRHALESLYELEKSIMEGKTEAETAFSFFLASYGLGK